MATVALTPQVTLIPGVRLEHTSTSYDSYQVDQADNVTPLTAESSFLSVLPMAHLKVQPRDNWNLRAAVTRTFARPNFSDLSPARTIDYTSQTVSQGNTALEPTYSINYDLLSRYFFQNIGFVSVAGFYKDISNVIYAQGSALVIDGQRFDVVQPQNVEEAWLASVEVGLRRRLDFLPGFLSGFGVEGNYTYTGSSVQIPGRAEAQEAPSEETPVCAWRQRGHRPAPAAAKRRVEAKQVVRQAEGEVRRGHLSVLHGQCGCHQHRQCVVGHVQLRAEQRHAAVDARQVAVCKVEDADREEQQGGGLRERARRARGERARGEEEARHERREHAAHQRQEVADAELGQHFAVVGAAVARASATV